jgi:predicted phosphoribosyltransferase
LAQALKQYAGRSGVLVLALPRGGVPVAYEVARELNAPLDVFVVRKLGVPGHEELAMGAIASGGFRVLDENLIQTLKIRDDVVEAVSERSRRELRRQELAFRDDRPPSDVREQIVILVDDGLATGATMRAAVAALRVQHPARIIVAAPTAAASTCEELESEVDECVCVMTPDPFLAVGLWYDDFSQTTDEEVRHLLRRAAENRTRGVAGRS